MIQHDTNKLKNDTASGRGLGQGGYISGNRSNEIVYITISTTGNTSDFGDLTSVRTGMGMTASTTRAVSNGGYESGANEFINTIEYVTIATTGDSADFGNTTYTAQATAATGNSTRGLPLGGNIDGGIRRNEINYVTIATLGDATDFGNLTAAKNSVAAGGSPTRGIIGGGYTGSKTDVIEFISLASTGDGADFGDLTDARTTVAPTGNGTRACFMIGNVSPAAAYDSNVIDFVTIATTGNATDFGDASDTRDQGQRGSMSTNTRGILMGGSRLGHVNIIEYITIPTRGNVTDFGDLNVAAYDKGTTSNSHGGLQSS